MIMTQNVGWHMTRDVWWLGAASGKWKQLFVWVWGGAVRGGGGGDRLCEENIMQHPATLHHSAPGHGALGLGRVWLMINGHYKLQHSISLPHTLDTLSSFPTPNVQCSNLVYRWRWRLGPKPRHMFHVPPHNTDKATLLENHPIVILSFQAISEEHISDDWIH